jgi:hypothetical protein
VGVFGFGRAPSFRSGVVGYAGKRDVSGANLDA